MARLEQVQCGGQGRPVIIFIHGLGGDLFETWIGPGSSKDDCWLHWVCADTQCDVWTLGYDAALSSWSEQAMPLPDQGTQVAQLLAVHSGLEGRKLVLVGHSMGGLVIKTLLTQAQASGDRGARDLVGRILGVVFLATPHQGSDLASLAKISATLVRTNAQVGDMSRHESHLRQIGTAFRTLRQEHKFKVAAFAETRNVTFKNRILRFFTLKTGLRVVDPSSSDPGLDGVVTVPLDEDHFSICKPANRDAQIHRALVKFINEIAEQRVFNASEQAQNSRTGGEEAAPLIMSTSALALFDVYTPECAKFYIKRSVDDQILPALAVRSIWLTGRSGVGKTSLVRRFIDQQRIRPLEISLSQLGANSDQEQVAREIIETVAASTGFKVKSFDIKSAAEAIRSLGTTCATPIFLDEIPVGPPTSGSTVATAIGLLLEASKRISGSSLRFIACSIENPSNENLNGKFREGFSVIELPKWEEKSISELVDLILENCSIQLSRQHRDDIINASNGSPRYIKTLARNILQRDQFVEMAEIIKITSNELRGL